MCKTGGGALLLDGTGAVWLGVLEGKPCGLDWAIGRLERLVYRLCGIDPGEEMAWTTYAKAMLAFNLLGFLAVYAIQRFQHVLPLNPEHLAAAKKALATWRAIHIPLTWTLFTSALVHVVAALYYATLLR